MDEIFQELQGIESAIKTIRYSMDAINDIDNDKFKIRCIACNIADTIDILIKNYSKILTDMESQITTLIEPRKDRANGTNKNYTNAK